MLRSYITTALRSMSRQPGYAALNVTGLAIGIACALLILLFVKDEMSHDVQHPDGVHRVISYATTSDDVMPMAVTPAILAPTVAAALPTIDAFCRIHLASESNLIWKGEERFYDEGVVFADSSFFRVFAFPLARGNPSSALVEPFSVVLTPSLAERLFGSDDPIGETIGFGDRHEYTVTGVLAEDPRQTHLAFSALLSFSTTERLDVWFYGSKGGFLNNWHIGAAYTYLRVHPDAVPEEVAPRITEVVAGILPDDGASYSYELQPVEEVHLQSSFQYDYFAGGNITSVYIFALVAVFMLAIASVNYMSLATARSMRRGTEVGIRKVLGADGYQLKRQFLVESVVTATFALVAALVLAALAMPLFNGLSGKSFGAEDVLAPSTLAWLIPMTLLVGLIAGGYPALVLSRFTPIHILKSARDRGGDHATLRRALVIFQFTATLALLIATATVYRQLQFFDRMDLGFDRDHLVYVEVPDPPSLERLEMLKARMEEDPRVVSAAASSGIPVGMAGRHDTRPGGRPQDERWLMTFYGVDYDFMETMGFDIIAGRGFSEELASDSMAAYILNEAAIRRLGWSSNPIGREFGWYNPTAGLKPGRVVGVVRDFHYEGFRQRIEPAFFAIAPDWTSMLAIRILPENQDETLGHLRRVWENVLPEYPFDYGFLGEGWGEMVSSERQFARVFAFFALLTLIIACLGLFGLASYDAEQRRAEVGVRKVMGASTPQIVLLLSRDAVVLVGIAFALAAPLSFLLMRRWLQDFAYRVELTLDVFILAGVIALLVAFATVSWQALRAATADPVAALRSE